MPKRKKEEELRLFDPDVPPSQEVRLADGVADGFAETVAMKIHYGSTRDLKEGAVAIEFTLEERRANAARTVARLVTEKLILEGYIVASDVTHILENFLEAEQA